MTQISAIPDDKNLSDALRALARLRQAMKACNADKKVAGTRSLLSLIDDWSRRAIEAHLKACAELTPEEFDPLIRAYAERSQKTETDTAGTTATGCNE
ncbi:hypothetical protein [Pseudooceanicola sp.]|uniref:hypothetical protein n=1 Tax=Pseudooceanicola sp. TaxID=1914328 RepID=UPI0035C7500A